MENSELSKAISVILSGLRHPILSEIYLSKLLACFQEIGKDVTNNVVKKRFKQVNAEIINAKDITIKKEIAIKFLGYFAGLFQSLEHPKKQLQGEFVQGMGFYVKLTNIGVDNTIISKDLNPEEGAVYSIGSTAILVSLYNNLVLVQELSISRPKLLVKNNIFIASLGNCFLVNDLYLRVVELNEPMVSLELLRDQIGWSNNSIEEKKDSLVHVGDWRNSKPASYFLVKDYKIIVKMFSNDPKQITIRWQNKNCIIQSELTDLWRCIGDPTISLNGSSKPLGFTDEIKIMIGKCQYILSYGKNK